LTDQFPSHFVLPRPKFNLQFSAEAIEGPGD
jgi:hypothetical protein